MFKYGNILPKSDYFAKTMPLLLTMDLVWNSDESSCSKESDQWKAIDF
jgi:hypothetical protein